MPRPCFRRKIWGIPPSSYFRPEGDIPSREEEVVLSLDQLEAIRLADLENLYQEEAAQRMGVSRSTFGRILDSAHKKVAEALVQGKPLKIEGGTVEILQPEALYSQGGFRCRRREGPKMQEMMGFEGRGMGAAGFCICPKCGYRKPHQAGVRCMDERCPQCGSVLVREGSYHHRLIEERKKGGE